MAFPYDESDPEDTLFGSLRRGMPMDRDFMHLLRAIEAAGRFVPTPTGPQEINPIDMQDYIRPSAQQRRPYYYQRGGDRRLNPNAPSLESVATQPRRKYVGVPGGFRMAPQDPAAMASLLATKAALEDRAQQRLAEERRQQAADRFASTTGDPEELAILGVRGADGISEVIARRDQRAAYQAAAKSATRKAISDQIMDIMSEINDLRTSMRPGSAEVIKDLQRQKQQLEAQAALLMTQEVNAPPPPAQPQGGGLITMGDQTIPIGTSADVPPAGAEAEASPFSEILGLGQPSPVEQPEGAAPPMARSHESDGIGLLDILGGVADDIAGILPGRIGESRRAEKRSADAKRRVLAQSFSPEMLSSLGDEEIEALYRREYGV